PEDLERPVLPLRDTPDELAGRLHGVGLGILEVGPGRECPARLVTGEDGTAHVVVLLHGREVPGDALVEVGAPGVAGLGAAQGEDADAVALLVRDGHDGVLVARGPGPGGARAENRGLSTRLGRRRAL